MEHSRSMRATTLMRGPCTSTSSAAAKHLPPEFDDLSARNAESTVTDEMSEDMNAHSYTVPLVVVVKPILVRSVEQINERRRALRAKRKAVMEAAAAADGGASALSPEFTTVTIREYPIAIGDNPGAQSGISLSMEWEHVSEITLPVKDYEDKRPPRRSGREMILPNEVRVARLREAGYTREDIVRGTRRLNIARGQRQRTYETLHLQPVFALSENVARSYRNFITFGEANRQQRKMLEQIKELTPCKEESPLAPEAVEADLTSFKSLSGRARRQSF